MYLHRGLRAVNRELPRKAPHHKLSRFATESPVLRLRKTSAIEPHETSSQGRYLSNELKDLSSNVTAPKSRLQALG